MELKDKVAIITGSSRGLGKAMALRFAREGARLMLGDVHDCGPVVKEIEAAGGTAMAVKTDVSDVKAVAEMVKKTAEAYGRIDVLVNNAAVVGGLEKSAFGKPLEELVAGDWDKFLDVNVKGTFICCQAVLPYMEKQGGGKIVNIASGSAFQGAATLIPYSTSKGGVMTLTYCLAQAMGQYGINVNAVAPGVVMTETMKVITSPEMEKVYESKQIFKEPLKPEDIAAAVAFLASDDARMITGQILAVNAGQFMH